MFGELKVQLRNESSFVELSEVCSANKTLAQLKTGLRLQAGTGVEPKAENRDRGGAQGCKPGKGRSLSQQAGKEVEPKAASRERGGG